MSSKPKVFITGVTGKLGSRLAALLINYGYEVRGLVKQKERVNAAPSGIVPFLGTLDDMEVIEEGVKGVDMVIHTAAIAKEAGQMVKELMHVNVDGTKNIVEACKKEKCDRIIFSSTIDVYGKVVKGVITEDTPPKPSDKYGYSKLIAEKVVLDSGLKYTILRLATIYGPGFEGSFFKVFEAIVDGKMAIVGNGKNHLAIVSIYDVLNAFLEVIKNNASVNKIYNLSDGVPHTQEELIDLAAEMLHAKKPERHVSKMLAMLIAKRKGLDSDEFRFLSSDRIVSIDKIKRELGFTPKVMIEQGGAELVSMFLSKRRIL